MTQITAAQQAISDPLILRHRDKDVTDLANSIPDKDDANLLARLIITKHEVQLCVAGHSGLHHLVESPSELLNRGARRNVFEKQTPNHIYRATTKALGLPTSKGKDGARLVNTHNADGDIFKNGPINVAKVFDGQVVNAPHARGTDPVTDH